MKTLLSIVLLAGLTAGCATTTTTTGSGARRVAITVTENGFEPVSITIPAGQPVTLAVTRKTDQTCATEIVIAEHNIRRDLPLNQTVEVTFTPSKPGEVRYACGMNMYTGKMIVQ